MGSGSSRNQVTVETAAPEVSDVVITRARVPPPVRQSTIDKTVTETGAEVGKLRPVLKVPEDSFDDDEVAQEDDLEDVHDLEETFNSLGITGSSDMEVQRQFQEFPVKDVEHENVRTKWNQFTGGEDLAAEGNGGWAVRSTSGPHRLDIPLSKIVNNNNSNTNYNNKSKSAPTKFSWNTTEVSSTPEEWIYQKSAVDGFDPEKFRRVNKKEPSIDDNKSSSAGSSRGDDVVLLHPHSVPDYDVSEQQILDSIEREFVS